MTCIAGVQDPVNGTVTLGADSLASAGQLRAVIAFSKLWTDGPWGFAFCGSPRMAQLLRYRLDLSRLHPGRHTSFSAFLATDFVDAARAVFSAGGCLVPSPIGDTFPGGLLIAYGGRLAAMHADFQVDQNNDGYQAIGSGGPHASASLRTTAGTDLSPEVRVRLAIEAASYHNNTVGGPIRVAVTERARDTVRAVPHTH